MSEQTPIKVPENRLHNTGRTHFKPGQSGNPGGRPKGLASLIREETEDGKELVRIAWEIAQGTLIIEETYYDKDGNKHTVDREPSHRDRMAAVEWLANRGWGKPVETHEFSGVEREIVLVPMTINPNDIIGVESNADSTPKRIGGITG